MNNPALPPDLFASYPIVYAVGNEYQIMVSTAGESVFWCKVGDKTYYDHSNGVLRSKVFTHKVTIPAEELDQAGRYTICFRKMIERLPYYPKLEDVQEVEYTFRRVPREKETLNVYLLSDAHCMVEEAVAAGNFFGDDMDFLILNGDIHEHSGAPELFADIHRIAGRITKGGIPVVYARGNHDLRGEYAEQLGDNTPTRNGYTYYTFRLGGVWGLVLDCGEDKRDDQEEYGGTICCHVFRQEETEYIRRIIAEKETGYAAEGIRNRLVVCHINFSQKHNPPFDIEYDTYGEWCRLIREEIKPDAILNGHEHKEYVVPADSEGDLLHPGCPVIVGGIPVRQQGNRTYSGTALVLSPGKIAIRYTDDQKNIKSEAMT